MQRFTQLFQDIDATTSTNEKVRSLQAYFQAQEAEPADKVWALYLLLGKTRRRTVTSRVLRDVFLQISDIPEWLFKDCYAQVGDSAEVIALLLRDVDLAGQSPKNSAIPCRGKRPFAPTEVDGDSQSHSSSSIPLHQWMEEVIPMFKAMETDEERRDLIVSWWAALDNTEIFVLNKILTGAFRVGASAKLVIKGLAAATGVSEAVLAHRLMGDFSPTVEFYTTLTSEEATQNAPSQPYPFFLATSLDEEKFQGEDFDRWRAEWKWDGIRAQVIKRDDQVFVWSRGEDLVTEQFPEIEAMMATFPNGIVMDGEILCWQDGMPLSFNHLQKRLGRKKVSKKVMEESPVHLIAYDLLEFGGIDIREKSWGDRTQSLTALLGVHTAPNLHQSVPLEFHSFAELAELRQNSRQQGAEGLVVKAIDSPYLVGRKRGYWWKYKVDPMSLDAVLIYAQAGSGKRANLFTDYTFALWQGETLVPFAKAYSGLDNAEIDALDKWIRRHTTERFGPVRSVEPIQVFEIGFEGIAESTRHKSGISVRFPRILRWRKDKPAIEADTLESAQELLAFFR
ncbi:ATP-dependent DNA ligase [Nodosilinea sp. LEGE 06152]|uniref:ATP-dependent DNA ligase n=1 Tax=Nodosilinea sp. LEGE 06152 TaxID=2777966 RepID=UPI00187DF89D|nr:ATP-dependent DNA ligase [Nodosilinea sp. LEGE 06152]MBE9155951.1 ATP-dependent DNA ligase [Nodosilinea sp. LEGE 06152]